MPRTPITNAMLEKIPSDVLLQLDNQLCFALHSASRRVVKAYRAELEPLDLTFPQYLVLLVLWEWEHNREPHPTVTALGERLDLDSGTLTPLLKRLEQKELITRERGKTDEREVLIYVTREGSAMKSRAREVPLKLLRRSTLSLGQIGKLREQLKELRSDLAAAS